MALYDIHPLNHGFKARNDHEPLTSRWTRTEEDLLMELFSEGVAEELFVHEVQTDPRGEDNIIVFYDVSYGMPVEMIRFSKSVENGIPQYTANIPAGQDRISCFMPSQSLSFEDFINKRVRPTLNAHFGVHLSCDTGPFFSMRGH